MRILLFLGILLNAVSAIADVRFITETENTADYKKFQMLNPKYAPQTDNYALDNEKRCKIEGYIYKKCDSGMFPADPCPYDGNLYANCCPDSYHYTAAECKSMGKGLSEYSCGGYYKCE